MSVPAGSPSLAAPGAGGVAKPGKVRSGYSGIAVFSALVFGFAIGMSSSFFVKSSGSGVDPVWMTTAAQLRGLRAAGTELGPATTPIPQATKRHMRKGSKVYRVSQSEEQHAGENPAPVRLSKAARRAAQSSSATSVPVTPSPTSLPVVIETADQEEAGRNHDEEVEVEEVEQAGPAAEPPQAEPQPEAKPRVQAAPPAAPVAAAPHPDPPRVELPAPPPAPPPPTVPAAAPAHTQEDLAAVATQASVPAPSPPAAEVAPQAATSVSVPSPPAVEVVPQAASLPPVLRSLPGRTRAAAFAAAAAAAVRAKESATSVAAATPAEKIASAPVVSPPRPVSEASAAVAAPPAAAVKKPPPPPAAAVPQPPPSPPSSKAPETPAVDPQDSAALSDFCTSGDPPDSSAEDTDASSPFNLVNSWKDSRLAPILKDAKCFPSEQRHWQITLPHVPFCGAL